MDLPYHHLRLCQYTTTLRRTYHAYYLACISTARTAAPTTHTTFLRLLLPQRAARSSIAFRIAFAPPAMRRSRHNTMNRNMAVSVR